LEYRTDLFHGATIERMVEHFQTLLHGIVADPEQRLADLPLLTEAEQQQLLIDWNATTAAYPDQCTHNLFEAQVAQTPDAVAIVFDPPQTKDEVRRPEGTRKDEQDSFIVHRSSFIVTYAELNQRANQLARHLQALGVGPDVRVGLCLERSPELIVGLLGI